MTTRWFGVSVSTNRSAFHEVLTTEHKLARKVALIGLSRGGLYCYNWATANPDKAACIYADAAVCDLKSWPGGKVNDPTPIVDFIVEHAGRP